MLNHWNTEIIQAYSVWEKDKRSFSFYCKKKMKKSLKWKVLSNISTIFQRHVISMDLFFYQNISVGLERVWSITNRLIWDIWYSFEWYSHANLNAYGFSIEAQRFVYSSSEIEKKMTRNCSTQSCLEMFLFGVPQKSLIGLLSFNMFFCSLLFLSSDTHFDSYFDNNTPPFQLMLLMKSSIR